MLRKLSMTGRGRALALGAKRAPFRVGADCVMRPVFGSSAMAVESTEGRFKNETGEKKWVIFLGVRRMAGSGAVGSSRELGQVPALSGDASTVARGPRLELERGVTYGISNVSGLL